MKRFNQKLLRLALAAFICVQSSYLFYTMKKDPVNGDALEELKDPVNGDALEELKDPVNGDALEELKDPVNGDALEELKDPVNGDALEELKDPVNGDALDSERLPTIMSTNNSTNREGTSHENLNPRVMVVDSIMYNGEPIVPVRLATLNDVVDRFYIIEGTTSFSGLKKEALFKDLNADIFEEYKDKIHWVIFDFEKNKIDLDGQHWVREWSLRTASMPAMKDDVEKGIISDPFVVINTDADEFPDPKDIQNFQPGMKYHGLVTTSPVLLNMTDFYYNLNWAANKGWSLGHTLPGHMVLNGFPMNALRRNRKKRMAAGWINGGYHMSYFFDADGIRKKLENSVHIELNKSEFKTDEHIEMCVSTGKDLFNRRGFNRIKWDYTQAPVPLQKFHEETCKKQKVDPSTGNLLFDM